MEKKKIFKYIAIACSAYFLLRQADRLIIEIIDNQFIYTRVMYVVAYTLIGLSLLLEKPLLMSAGAGAFSIGAFRDLIFDGSYLFDGWSSLFFILFLISLLSVINYLIMGLYGIAIHKKNKNSNLLGVMTIVSWIVVKMGWGIYYRAIDWNPSKELITVANFVYFVMLCMIVLYHKDETPNTTIDNSKSTKANNSIENQMDQLTKLKTLLDNGVISQEEFDDKKKQILGL